MAPVYICTSPAAVSHRVQDSLIQQLATTAALRAHIDTSWQKCIRVRKKMGTKHKIDESIYGSYAHV